MPSATVRRAGSDQAGAVPARACCRSPRWFWRAFEIGGTDLGANPVEKIQDTLGQWGLRLLLITLAVTPLRDWFNAPWLIQLRRMLGLYAFFYVLLHFLTWLILDQDLYWSGILPDIARAAVHHDRLLWRCCC